VVEDGWCFFYGLSITGFDGHAIQLNGDNGTILANYIGIAPDGTCVGNGGAGIHLNDVSHWWLGDPWWGSENVISGNTMGGILIEGSNTRNNHIVENYIGTNPFGTASCGTQPYGVHVLNGPHDNFIGEGLGAKQNLISGNTIDGIHISGTGTDDNTINGNLIGVNRSGTAAIPNTQNGVRLNGADRTIILENLISGNQNGVYVDVSSVATRISGNKIGTNLAGTAEIPNSQIGLFVTNGSTATLVGDGSVTGRNIISGNGGAGIEFNNNTSGAIVRGNYIGTDITGTASIANASGISIFDSENNTVGGSSAAHANLISGNSNYGLQIVMAGAIDNVIEGNFIGTQANGTSALGNGNSGIRIFTNAADNIIRGNTIAHNTSEGIGISADGGLGNRITQNSFFDNGELAIDLSVDDVTVNDDGDSDTGPNNLQNFPVEENATLITNTLTITGFAPAGAVVEFYIADDGPSPSVHTYSESFGEGNTYLFSATEGSADDADAALGIYTDDGTGPGTARTENRFSFTVDASTMGLDGTSRLTMLSIASDGSTSEFSQVFLLNAPEICDDGLDNDGDGLIDCEDPDCNGSLDCPDNDNDGYTDSIDLDDDNDGILDADEHVVVMTTYQPPCNPLFMDFTGPATLVGGTDLQEGAVYKYTAVSPGIDAKVTIIKNLNQSAPSIDDNASNPTAFKPRSGFVLNGIGDQSYTEYLFEFVSGVGETPVIIPELFINFNDIDGGSTYGEQNWVQLPTSYTEDDPTDLTTVLGDWVLGNSGTTEYVGATNANPQANFSARYINRTWLKMRVGVENRTAGTNSGTRAHSIEFACLSNYLNPTTYLMDFDKDGHPNFTDLDSDNDGIYDCIESLSGQAHTDGILTGGVDAWGIPLSVSDGSGGVNYSYGDADSDGILNAYQLDSDFDGCSDALEAGFTDNDFDGELGDSPLTVDSDGRVTSEIDGYTTPTITVSPDFDFVTASLQSGCPDNDIDHISDFNDLDDDNDGILDVDESRCDQPTYANSNSGSGAYQDQLYIFDWSGLGSTLTDGDAQPYTINHLVITATFTDVVVNGGDVNFEDFGTTVYSQVALLYETPGTSEMIRCDHPVTSYSFTLTLSALKNGKAYPLDVLAFDSESTSQDSDEHITFQSNGGPWTFLEGVNRHSAAGTKGEFTIVGNKLDVDNTENNNEGNSIFYSSDASVVRAVVSAPSLQRQGVGFGIYLRCDGDDDGVVNDIDLDSDNDGIYDAVESGSNMAQSGGALSGGVDVEGIPLSVSNAASGVNYTYSDTDTDLILNAYDSDSDGDACNDVIEAGFPDADGDGQLGGLVPPTVDGEGKVTPGGL